jgi:hypothetical protein
MPPLLDRTVARRTATRSALRSRCRPAQIWALLQRPQPAGLMHGTRRLRSRAAQRRSPSCRARIETDKSALIRSCLPMVGQPGRRNSRPATRHEDIAAVAETEEAAVPRPIMGKTAAERPNPQVVHRPGTCRDLVPTTGRVAFPALINDGDREGCSRGSAGGLTALQALLYSPPVATACLSMAYAESAAGLLGMA